MFNESKRRAILSEARKNCTKDYEGQFRAEQYAKGQRSGLLPGERMRYKAN